MASYGSTNPASPARARALARLVTTLAALSALLTTWLMLAAPVLAQEGGHGEPVPVERKLLAIAVLAGFVVLMVAWAWLYRRVNRA